MRLLISVREPGATVIATQTGLRLVFARGPEIAHQIQGVVFMGGSHSGAMQRVILCQSFDASQSEIKRNMDSLLSEFREFLFHF
jgi:hypothetical protein